MESLVAENRKDPFFGHKFLFDSKFQTFDVLSVEVFNHRGDSKEMAGHPLIGRINVPLDEIVSGKNKKMHVQYTIVDHLGQPKGKIHMEFSWNEKEDAFDLYLDKFIGSRPWYLRSENYYGGFKSIYDYGRTLPIARSVAPILESASENLLLKIGIKPSGPETPPPEDTEKALQVADAKLTRFFRFCDETIDMQKDALINFTKEKKKIIKTRAVDSATTAIEYARSDILFSLEPPGCLHELFHWECFLTGQPNTYQDRILCSKNIRRCDL
jgi:hypothetical protein